MKLRLIKEAKSSFEATDDIFLVRSVNKSQPEPPYFIRQPILSEVTPNESIIMCETNTVTSAVLYVGTEENFDIEDNYLTCVNNDTSIDGKEHSIIMGHKIIDLKNEKYYLKVYATDFYENHVISDEIEIEKGQLYKMLIMDFVILNLLNNFESSPILSLLRREKSKKAGKL